MRSAREPVGMTICGEPATEQRCYEGDMTYDGQTGRVRQLRLDSQDEAGGVAISVLVALAALTKDEGSDLSGTTSRRGR